MSEIWQTTNQQPWVTALADGRIKVKTRNVESSLPVGATVFLHASKSSVWKDWRGLKWARKLDVPKLPRGVIVAVATVKAVGHSDAVLTSRERPYWDVEYVDRNGVHVIYNSAASFAVRFKDVVKLKKPVAVTGMLTPFAHAKDATVKKVIKANPSLRKRLEKAHTTKIEQKKRERKVETYEPLRSEIHCSSLNHGCFGLY